MKQRAVIRLELETLSKRQLDELADKRGMTQIAILSRLVKWFGRQDELVQASILGLLSEEMLGDVNELLHKRLGSASKTAKKG
jgi:hypothetical protein